MLRACPYRRKTRPRRERESEAVNWTPRHETHHKRPEPEIVAHVQRQDWQGDPDDEKACQNSRHDRHQNEAHRLTRLALEGKSCHAPLASVTLTGRSRGFRSPPLLRLTPCEGHHRAKLPAGGILVTKAFGDDWIGDPSAPSQLHPAR